MNISNQARNIHERLNKAFSNNITAVMLGTLNKRILMISFASETNMAAMPIVFCISWDQVITLYNFEVVNNIIDSPHHYLPKKCFKVFILHPNNKTCFN